MQDTKLATKIADIIDEFAKRKWDRGISSLMSILDEMETDAGPGQYQGIFEQIERARDAQNCNIDAAVQFIVRENISKSPKFMEDLLRDNVKPSELMATLELMGVT